MEVRLTHTVCGILLNVLYCVLATTIHGVWMHMAIPVVALVQLSVLLCIAYSVGREDAVQQELLPLYLLTLVAAGVSCFVAVRRELEIVYTAHVLGLSSQSLRLLGMRSIHSLLAHTDSRREGLSAVGRFPRVWLGGGVPCHSRRVPLARERTQAH